MQHTHTHTHADESKATREKKKSRQEITKDYRQVSDESSDSMLKLLALRPLLTAAAAFSSSGEKWRTESADETCPTVEKKRAIEEIPLKKKNQKNSSRKSISPDR